MNSIPFMDLGRHHAPLAEEMRAAFDRVVSTSAFILGQEVERFEAAFADYCGTRHCIGVASGTAALTIMLQAAGIGAGDEVIVPAHTFIATASAVVHAGAMPVCADVHEETGLIDPESVSAAVGPKTAAILPVHLYGQPCAMDELRRIADRDGLALFEDAAQAHGATYRGARVGALGNAGAFSFYPSKNLGALGDGGAICTDSADLAVAARRLRDLGRDGDPTHDRIAYNERLDGLQAALLGVKLPHLDDWNAARRRVADAYRKGLDATIETVTEAQDSPSVYHLFPVRVDARDEISKALSRRGVATGIHYPLAIPDQPALPWLAGSDAPVARDWAARELSLPLFPEMTNEQVQSVIQAVEVALTEVGSPSRTETQPART